jgi:menaquinone-9 beta-reductase
VLFTSRADVLVVGAGPAGIASAIAASLKGLRVVVADLRKPPIDKPCGEGLLPEAVVALRALGIDLNAVTAYPVSGIRFEGDNLRATAVLPREAAYGLRRTTLHDLMVERALRLGVTFRWGVRISGLCSRGAVVDGEEFGCQWVIGADGHNSAVRKWAGFASARQASSRFGFRRHFAIQPWSDLVEVYWADPCQLFVTPIAPDEVCLAVLTRDSRMRIENAFALFPQVEKRLRGARPTSGELGAVTVLARSKNVMRGRVAVVGDASFALDAIAGQGMGLAFRQATHLAEALAGNELFRYEAEHRRITATAWRFTRLLLEMTQRPWLRRKALRLFARRPDLFSQMVSAHTREKPADELKVHEVFGLGWQFLRA